MKLIHWERLMLISEHGVGRKGGVESLLPTTEIRVARCVCVWHRQPNKTIILKHNPQISCYAYPFIVFPLYKVLAAYLHLPYHEKCVIVLSILKSYWTSLPFVVCKRKKKVLNNMVVSKWWLNVLWFIFFGELSLQ